MEVVSPAKASRDRDNVEKREQYADPSIPEYWILDLESQRMMLLLLEDAVYGEVGQFTGRDRILSPALPELALTAAGIWQAGA